MGTILQSFKESWKRLSMPMQIGSITLVAGVFLSLIYLTIFSTPEMQVLFSNLMPEDAGSVISILQEQGIPYKIGENGSAILVPEEHVHETRMVLATQGLPRGGIVGYEIFNTTRLGETEADRQMRFLWALQGELTRTIREIDEIVDARIHIVLPRRSLFIQESQPSTASVLLQLRPGVILNAQQVRGIGHLIATSVEGLTPDNVTIVDSRGNVLSEVASAQGVDGRAISQRMDLERAYEKQLEDSITAMLERIYGYGNVVARVNADLDFDLQEQYHEIYEPVTRTGGIVRSEQSFEETQSGTQIQPGGQPGVDSNVPGYVGQEAGQSEYERRESTTNYEVNRTEIRQTTTPGEVSRLSVSVWVNGELNEAQLGSVQESVSRAIGMRVDRGDEIFVTSVPFETGEMFTLPSGETVVQQVTPLWLYGVAGAIVLLLVLVLALRKKKAPVTAEVGTQIDVVVDEDPYMRQDLTPEERERSEVKKRIQGLAKDKPKEFAQLMKAWLVDE